MAPDHAEPGTGGSMHGKRDGGGGLGSSLAHEGHNRSGHGKARSAYTDAGRTAGWLPRNGTKSYRRSSTGQRERERRRL
jgi:hypothetical protein